MKRYRLHLALCLFIAPTLFGKSISIENESVRLTVHANGTVDVRNVESGTTLKQGIPRTRTAFTVSNLKAGNDEISLELETVPRTEVTWKLIDRKPEVVVEIRPLDVQGDMPNHLSYPYPFAPPSKQAEWVLPNRSGALYPVTDVPFGPKPWKVGGKELLMSWHGLGARSHLDRSCRSSGIRCPS